MSETKERWNSESPEYFKKLKRIAIKIGGSAAAMLTAINTIPFIQLPDIVSVVLSVVLVLCVGIAGTSQLTKK